MRRLWGSKDKRTFAAATVSTGALLCINQLAMKHAEKSSVKSSGAHPYQTFTNKTPRLFSYLNIFVHADSGSNIVTMQDKASEIPNSSSKDKPSKTVDLSVREDEVSDDEVSDDDAAWEEQKKKCGFCRHFLESPCNRQFKVWSKCVDGAKEADEDFVVKCSECTQQLITCTADYPDYFLAAMEATGEDEGIEEDGQEPDSKGNEGDSSGVSTNDEDDKDSTDSENVRKKN